METRSKKLQDILFGKIGRMDGGLPIVGSLTYPKSNKTEEINWEGNLGLIITMWQKIEKLEEKIKSIKKK